MKYFAVFFVAQVAFCAGHVIRAPWADCGAPCGPLVVPAPPVYVSAPPQLVVPPPCAPCAPTLSVVQTNDVAGSLADTLSLLTVSSLLADKLPYGPQVLVAAPPCAPPCAAPCAPPPPCHAPAWIV